MLFRQMISQVQVFIIEEIQQAGDGKQPAGICAGEVPNRKGDRRTECAQEQHQQDGRKQHGLEVLRPVHRHGGVGEKAVMLLHMALVD